MAKKKLSAMRACGCFDRINKQLAPANLQLDWKQTMNFTTFKEGEALYLRAVKIDERKKGTWRPVFLNYCPFCGVKYGADA